MTPDLIPVLLAETPRWIESQRHTHRPSGIPIPEPHLAGLLPFFRPETIERVRVTSVRTIENPGFFATLGSTPMDLRRSAGITYGDTVLISEAHAAWPPSLSLLFHEMVHVVQFALLGVPRFSQEYVLGWAQNGRDYFRIPLEVQAYDLQREFDRGTLPEGPIESMVATTLTRVGTV